MTVWVVTITVHGFEDDISMLQFIAVKKITATDAVRVFNQRFAGKKRSEIHDPSVIFPLPFAYDPIGLIYKDPDDEGFFTEAGSYRAAYVEITKGYIGR